jgi:hypothetical protein
MRKALFTLGFSVSTCLVSLLSIAAIGRINGDISKSTFAVLGLTYVISFWLVLGSAAWVMAAWLWGLWRRA